MRVMSPGVAMASAATGVGVAAIGTGAGVGIIAATAGTSAAPLRSPAMVGSATVGGTGIWKLSCAFSGSCDSSSRTRRIAYSGVCMCGLGTIMMSAPLLLPTVLSASRFSLMR